MSSSQPFCQHVGIILDAIRNNRCPNCDLETEHKRMPDMHLDNVSRGMGRDLMIDLKNGHINDGAEGQKLWSRIYEKG